VAAKLPDARLLPLFDGVDRGPSALRLSVVLRI
jgi:hypothetical protein